MRAETWDVLKKMDVPLLRAVVYQAENWGAPQKSADLFRVAVP
jgi:hypothetical protein